MRGFVLSLCLMGGWLPGYAAFGQAAGAAAAPVAAPVTLADLQRAMSGAWVGTLEYRDYSEPPSSTKRVKLPTWLQVAAAGGDLKFSYIYDDGPTKTVTETSVVRIDMAGATYSEVNGAGKVTESYTIAGLGQMHEGRGVLTLTGKGTENDAPADVRLTLRMARNILEMTRETAALKDGKAEPFSFRHTYTFVRAEPPAGAAASR